MPQVFFTGQGTYLQAKNLFDPVEAIRYAGETQAKLMEYSYNIKQQRQKQLLELTDIKTDNYMFDQLQKKAADNIEGFTNEAIDIFKKSVGNPTTEDWINIGKARRNVEQSNQEMLNKSQRYKESFNLLMKDGGKTFDWDRNIKMLYDFSQNPEKGEITPLELRYKTVDEIFNSDYKDHPFYKDAEITRGDKDGQEGVYLKRIRKGMEDDQKRLEAFNNLWAEDVDFQRTIKKERAELKDADVNRYASYKNDYDYALKTYFPEYGKEENMFHAYKPSSGRGGLNIGIGSYGGWSFAEQSNIYNPVTGSKENGFSIKKKSGDVGIPISLTGEVSDMSGNKIQSTGRDVTVVTELFKDHAVGTLLKGSKEVDDAVTLQIESDADKSSQYLNASMLGKVFESIDENKRTIIYQDGKYKVSKPIVEQQVYLDLNKGNNRTNVYNQLKATLNDPNLEKKINKHFGVETVIKSNKKQEEINTDVLP